MPCHVRLVDIIGSAMDGSDASTASGGSDVHNDHAHNGLKGGPAPPE